MSKNDGGAAFPIPPGAEVRGLSVRDYFAAKAMQAQCTPLGGEEGWQLDKPSHREMMVAECYAIADAMLAERSKP